MTTVLFACVHNAGRSQMAAAFFTALADPEKARAISAGTQPGPHVHAEVVTAMRDAGLDVARAQPTLLTAELAANVNLLVTMGCGEECPFVPGVQVVDWAIDDPKGQPPERVRAIRDTVRDHVVQLLEARGWMRAAQSTSGGV
jgi:arsenate reductase